MRLHAIRRRLIPLAFVCAAVGAGGCGGSAPQTGAVRSAGVAGVYFYVTVVKPSGGTITSLDGRINCGVGGTACGNAAGQTKYLWSESPVTLVAVPDGAHNKVFQQWAGDCSGTSTTCVLTAGPDRFVVAAFQAAPQPPSPPPPGTGQGNQTFGVTVSRPVNGTVTSADGAIRCGTGGAACKATYAWAATVTLTAAPDTGYVFTSWAGDCTLTGPCVLSTAKSGADKTVVAVFSLPQQAGHGFFAAPADHGPAYFDFVAQASGALNCASATCHGPDLAGRGIAPACAGCHASAGWAGSWQANCSFCHGTRNASTKAGPYDVAAHPTWAAPPDAVGQRLTGVAAAARTGAHQAHLTGVNAQGTSFAPPFRCQTCHAVPADLSHVGGASARATVVLSGAGQASLPASLGSYDPASGTCASYCHGAFAGGSAATPAWANPGGAAGACGTCHGLPPPPPHAQSTDCEACHDGYTQSTVNLSKHLNGVVDAVACGGCHGLPPATGAHLAHSQALGPVVTYGDLRVFQDFAAAGAVPATGSGYQFGCGLCHPLDLARHRDGVVQVELTPPSSTSPATNLRALNAANAAYAGGGGSCSGVYCHSTGEAQPRWVKQRDAVPGAPILSPAWSSYTPGHALACDACHDDPPAYASGGPGSATANTHVVVADDGWEMGHYAGFLGPWHGSWHGGWAAPSDSAPITCQTCHAATVDPAATGPSGVYWIDTTGNYRIDAPAAADGSHPASDPGRLTDSMWTVTQCANCHAPVQGRVLPLRHVNGAREVVFDLRTSSQATDPAAWPVLSPARGPYWFVDEWAFQPTGVPGAHGDKATSSVWFDLNTASWDGQTKTCSGVACHLSQTQVTWGTKPVGWANCGECHVTIP